MKKYTIEEIRKWIDQYDEVFSGPKDILDDLDTYGEKVIDDANGYTPDTHVENENKFEGILEDDTDYIDDLTKDGPDPAKDSIY